MNSNGLSLHIGNGLLVGQAFDLFGGLFLILVGALILYTLVTWRFRALQLDGETLGVRRRGPYFHGVYRYVLRNGEIREATSIQGTSTAQGFSTGRHVPIQVMADKPGEARERHTPWLWALAGGLLLSGGWLLYIAITVSKRSPITWILILLALAFVAHWLWTRVKTLFAKMAPLAAADPWSALPIEPAEAVSASPATSVSFSSPRSNSRYAGPILFVVGLGICGLALWEARGLIDMRNAVRTSGVVTELSEGSVDRSGDTFLFPVVRYTAQDGSVQQFHDRTGARPSPFKVGDTVPVMYLADRPTTAGIDRGLANWEPVGWLACLGIVMSCVSLVGLRTQWRPRA